MRRRSCWTSCRSWTKCKRCSHHGWPRSGPGHRSGRIQSREKSQEGQALGVPVTGTGCWSVGLWAQHLRISQLCISSSKWGQGGSSRRAGPQCLPSSSGTSASHLPPCPHSQSLTPPPPPSPSHSHTPRPPHTHPTPSHTPHSHTPRPLSPEKPIE